MWICNRRDCVLSFCESLMFLICYLLNLQVLCNLISYFTFVCFVLKVTNKLSRLGHVYVMCVYLFTVVGTWLVTIIKYLNPESWIHWYLSVSWPASPYYGSRWCEKTLENVVLLHFYLSALTLAAFREENCSWCLPVVMRCYVCFALVDVN